MNEIVYNYYSIHGGFSSLATFIDGQNLFGWCSIARESTLSWSWSLEFWTSSTGGLNYVGLEETRRVITIFPWNFSKKRRVYYTFRHIHIPTIIPNLWVCGKLCEGIPWFSHGFPTHFQTDVSIVFPLRWGRGNIRPLGAVQEWRWCPLVSVPGDWWKNAG
jgi:hypothetical protein